MNLIVVRESDIWETDGQRFVSITDKRRISHIRHVLRAEVGKVLKLGIINSTQDTATVVAVDASRVDLRLSDAFLTHIPPATPLVDLVIGLPRPKTLDKFLQYAASIGVARIKLVCSSRVELDYLKSHQLEGDSLEKSLILGMEQGVSTFMPQIELFKSFGALERHLKNEACCVKLIAHPNTTDTLGSLGINRHQHGPIMVAIGPEGGWTEKEVEFYEGLGFKPFNIGDRILRTEVAIVAIVAQLSLLLSDVTLRDGIPPAER